MAILKSTACNQYKEVWKTSKQQTWSCNMHGRYEKWIQNFSWRNWSEEPLGRL